MSLFGLFPTPEWRRFAAFPHEVKHDLAAAIYLNSMMRRRIADDLAGPLMELIEGPQGTPLAKVVGLPINLDNLKRARIVNAIYFSFLSGSVGRIFKSVKLELLPPERLVDCVGMLALSDPEVMSRASGAAALQQMYYSQDGDEARVQVLVEVMQMLGVEDMDCIGYISERYFADAWKRAERDLFGRHSVVAADALEKARRLFEQLDGRGRETILAFGGALSKKKEALTANKSTEQENRPFDPLEFQKAHPLLYVPFPRLVDLYMSVRNDTYRLIQEQRIIPYELRRIANAKPTCPKEVLDDAIELDCMIYAYAAVVAAASDFEPKFPGSGVWKKLTETFEKKNSFQSNAEMRVNGTFGAVSPSFSPDGPRDYTLAVNLMSRCRKVGSEYLKLDPTKRQASVLTLFGATVVLKGIGMSPAFTPALSSMVLKHQEVLRKKLQELVQGNLVQWDEQKDIPVT